MESAANEQNVRLIFADAEDDQKQLKQHPTNYSSFFNTCFNELNTLSGIGILSTPYAVAAGGWLSLILLFAIAIAAFYTALLIKRCMEADSTMKTYPDIGDRAFGKKGRFLISTVISVELYLVATGFLILEGDNLHYLFPKVEFEVAGFHLEAKQTFVIIVALIILPTVWLDNLSMLSYISASGVLASVIILVSVFWIGAFDGIGFHRKGKLLNWDGIPTAISLYAFCYCSHPVLPTLYSSMRKKHQFTIVLIVCFFLCTLSNALMAMIGYLMFGSEVESQVTLNLPIRKLSSSVAIYTTLVSPLAKYALMVTPIVNSATSWVPCYYNKKPFHIIFSTALLISTVIVALAVPFFGYLMSLVGGVLSVTASIIFPCLCYLKISGIYTRLGYETVLIVGIVIMGIIVATIGGYTALLQIVEHL